MLAGAHILALFYSREYNLQVDKFDHIVRRTREAEAANKRSQKKDRALLQGMTRSCHSSEILRDVVALFQAIDVVLLFLLITEDFAAEVSARESP